MGSEFNVLGFLTSIFAFLPSYETSINLAAFQASGDAWIRVTINDYSHETHEKTRNIIYSSVI